MGRAPRETVELVIDAGNGNIKASIGDGFEIIPSIFRFEDGYRVQGGFKLNGKHCIVGWDNDRRDDIIRVINDDKGKIKYLPLLVAGTLSYFRHLIPRKALVKVYLMTLNNLDWDTVVRKLAEIQELEIDGEKFDLTFKLVEMLPEGYGAALYAKQQFPDKQTVAVLDIGNGTLNFSQYSTKTPDPIRQKFQFIPCGFSSVVKFVANEYRKGTTSGMVHEERIRQALNHNSYEYYTQVNVGTDNKVTDIRPYTEKALIHWLNQPELQEVLIKALDVVAFGIPIVACGGGFECKILQDYFRQALGNTDLFHVPPNPVSLGVQGVQQELNRGNKENG